MAPSTTGERAAPPLVVVVMGTAGCGKSTIGALLARRVNGVFIDADDLHSAASVEKMRSGIPLTDEDRLPWLRRVGDAARAAVDSGQRPIVACSALRRSYRDIIRDRAGETLFVHLDGTPELLQARMGLRDGHFMPASLLASQLSTLEPLGPDERGAKISIDAAEDDIVAEAVHLLQEEDR